MLENFLTYLKQHIKLNLHSIIHLLCRQQDLMNILSQIDHKIIDNYLYTQFTIWLSRYASYAQVKLKSYFLDECDLNNLCHAFIRFCFDRKIQLDARKTLQSFETHNRYSDEAIKLEALALKPKPTVNLLGFGLDHGNYEQVLADYLLNNGIALHVNVYGFDPYAKQVNSIVYLTLNEIKNTSITFDLVIARWVLHHVATHKRWHEFECCLKKCNSDSRILVIEHGILMNEPSLLEKKFFYLLNAVFDIVANIGIRPYYFTQSTVIGQNFFIDYLDRTVFDQIVQNTECTLQNWYHIGPTFPHQSIIILSK
jgi:hypothetical protein